MPKKETNAKAKEWERERRERLNESFNLLSSLLPCYDPSVTKSKIEILQKAITYITDLQKENRGLNSDKKDNAWKQINALKHHVDKLLCRVQQLSALLKDAGISIPPEVPKDGQKIFNGRQPKWSNKFRQEDIAALLKKNKKPTAKKKQSSSKSKTVLCDHLEKKECNGASVVDQSSNNKRVRSSTSKRRQNRISSDKTKISYNCRGKKSKCKELATQQYVDVNPNSIKSNNLNNSPVSKLAGTELPILDSNVTVLTSTIPQVPKKYAVITSAVTTTSINQFQQSPCIVLASASQPIPSNNILSQTPYIVKTESSQLVKKATVAVQPLLEILPKSSPIAEASLRTQKKTSAVVVTNSHLLTAPIMATGIQACPVPTVLSTQGVGLADLGPGTLILTNGNIVPILPSANSSNLLCSKVNTNLVNQATCIPTLPDNSIVLMQNSVKKITVNCDNTSTKRVYSFCLPKPLRPRDDFTKTTFVNKVPISAVTQKSNAQAPCTSVCSPLNKISGKDNPKSSRANLSRTSDSSKKSAGRGSISKAKSCNRKTSNSSLKDGNLVNANKIVKTSTGSNVPLSTCAVVSSPENFSKPIEKWDKDSTLQPNDSGVNENNILSDVETVCKTDISQSKSCSLIKRKRASDESKDGNADKRPKGDETTDDVKKHSSMHSVAVTTSSSLVEISHELLRSSVSPNASEKEPSDSLRCLASVAPACNSDSSVLDSISKECSTSCVHNTVTATETTATPVTSSSLDLSTISNSVLTNTSILATNAVSIPCTASVLCPTVHTTPVTFSHSPSFNSNVCNSVGSTPSSISSISSAGSNTASLANCSLNSTALLDISTILSSPSTRNTSSIVLNCGDPDINSEHTSSRPSTAGVPNSANFTSLLPLCSVRDKEVMNTPAECSFNSSEHISTSANANVCGGSVNSCVTHVHNSVSSSTAASAPSGNATPIDNVTLAERSVNVTSAVVLDAQFASYANVTVTASSMSFITNPSYSSSCSSAANAAPVLESSISSISFVPPLSSSTLGTNVSTPVTNAMPNTSCSTSCNESTKSSNNDNPVINTQSSTLRGQKSFLTVSGCETIKDSNDKSSIKAHENYSIDCLCGPAIKDKCQSSIDSEIILSNSIARKDDETTEHKQPDFKDSLGVEGGSDTRTSSFSIKCVMENKTEKDKIVSTLDHSCSSHNAPSTELNMKNKSSTSPVEGLVNKHNDVNVLYASKSTNNSVSNNSADSLSRINSEKSVNQLFTKQCGVNSREESATNRFICYDKKQSSSYEYSSESGTHNCQLHITSPINAPSHELSVGFTPEPLSGDNNIHISEHGVPSKVSFGSRVVAATDKNQRLLLQNSSSEIADKSSNLSVLSRNEINENKKTNSVKEGSQELKSDFSVQIGNSSALPSESDYTVLTPISVNNAICSSAHNSIKGSLNELNTNNNPPACVSLHNSEFASDLFSSLQVPNNEHHSESTSPTAAFLLTFPVVASSKGSDMINDSQDIGSDSLHGAPHIYPVDTPESRVDVISARTPTFQSLCKKDKSLPETNFGIDIPYGSYTTHQDIMHKQYLPSESGYKVNRDPEIPQMSSSVKLFESDSFAKEGSKINKKSWTVLSETSNSQSKIQNEENSKRLMNSQTHSNVNRCNNNNNNQEVNNDKVAKFKDHFSDSRVGKSSSDILSNNTQIESVSHSANVSLTSIPNMSSFSSNNYSIPSFNSKTLSSSEEQNKDSSKQRSDESVSVKDKNCGILPGYRDISQTQTSVSKICVSETNTTRVNNPELDSLSHNVISYSQFMNLESPSKSGVSKYPPNLPPIPLEMPKNSMCSLPIHSSKSHPNGSLPSTSQCEFAISQTTENLKFPPMPSFSVSNNSSNFSILSWTTLSPMTTVASRQQSTDFYLQPTQTCTHQSSLASSKKLNNQICFSENTLPKSLEFHNMYNSPHKNLRQDPATCSVSSKPAESFSHSLLNVTARDSSSQVPVQQYQGSCKKTQNACNEKCVSNLSSGPSDPYPRVKPSHSEHQNHFPMNWISVPAVGAQQSSLLPSNSSSAEGFNHQEQSSAISHGDASTCKDMDVCSIGNSSNLFANNVSSACPTFDSKTYTSHSSPVISSHISLSSYQNSSQGKGNHTSFLNDNVSGKNHANNKTNFKKISDIQSNQPPVNEAYPVPWLQGKLSSSGLSTGDITSSSFVPSLPTLVGDLALGTNYVLPLNENIHKNKTVPHLSTGINDCTKNSTTSEHVPTEKIQEKLSQGLDTNTQSKDLIVMKNSAYDNCSPQLSAGSFLSVSQLVDQANSSSGPSRDHSITHHCNLFIHRMDLQNKENSYEMQHSEMYPSGESKQGADIYNAPSGQDTQSHKSVEQSLHPVNVKLSNDSNSVQTNDETIETRKVDTNQGIGNNRFRSNIVNAVPLTSSSSRNFSSTFDTHTTLSISSNHIPWSTPIDVPRQANMKVGSKNCKTSVSSYSAEALIGLNPLHSNDRVCSVAHDSVGSKIVTLPSPVVTERFSSSQFPPPPPPSTVSRSLQVPPFSGDSILANNYFSPVGLSSHTQDICPNENEQAMNSWRNLTPHIYRDQQEYKNLNSVEPPSAIVSSTGQGSNDLLKHSKYMPSVGTSHPHPSLTSRSIPCNFLPDLGSTSSYKGPILSESVNPFMFTSSSVPPAVSREAVCHSEKLAPNSHTVVSSNSPIFYSPNTNRNSAPVVTSSASHMVKTTGQGNAQFQCNSKGSVSQRASNCNPLHQVQNLGSIPKQRNRKRATEPVSSAVAGNGSGLMDLAYLGVSPIIGSPVIADDGMYVNHSSTFLGSGSQHTASSLYSSVPPSSQGAFYSAPHCTGPAGGYISHPNNLIPNASCSDHMNSRLPPSNATVSPNAVNSSSSSLTNFNLSTIFPEINEKVI